MADVSDDGIRKSLAKVTSDCDPTNWLSLGYAEGSTDRFVLSGAGTGGLAELSRSLSASFLGYAYVRIQNKPMPPTFVLVQFVGREGTALQKAKLIVHGEDITRVLGPVNERICASCAEDLTEDRVTAALRKK